MKKALSERRKHCARAGCKVRTPPARPSARHTHTHTHRQDRLQYTAPLASAQCNNLNISFPQRSDAMDVCFCRVLVFWNYLYPYAYIWRSSNNDRVRYGRNTSIHAQAARQDSEYAFMHASDAYHR